MIPEYMRFKFNHPVRRPRDFSSIENSDFHHYTLNESSLVKNPINQYQNTTHIRLQDYNIKTGCIRNSKVNDNSLSDSSHLNMMTPKMSNGKTGELYSCEMSRKKVSSSPGVGQTNCRPSAMDKSSDKSPLLLENADNFFNQHLESRSALYHGMISDQSDPNSAHQLSHHSKGSQKIDAQSNSCRDRGSNDTADPLKSRLSSKPSHEQPQQLYDVKDMCSVLKSRQHHKKSKKNKTLGDFNLQSSHSHSGASSPPTVIQKPNLNLQQLGQRSATLPPDVAKPPKSDKRKLTNTKPSFEQLKSPRTSMEIRNLRGLAQQPSYACHNFNTTSAPSPYSQSDMYAMTHNSSGSANALQSLDSAQYQHHQHTYIIQSGDDSVDRSKQSLSDKESSARRSKSHALPSDGCRPDVYAEKSHPINVSVKDAHSNKCGADKQTNCYQIHDTDSPLLMKQRGNHDIDQLPPDARHYKPELLYTANSQHLYATQSIEYVNHQRIPLVSMSDTLDRLMSNGNLYEPDSIDMAKYNYETYNLQLQVKCAAKFQDDMRLYQAAHGMEPSTGKCPDTHRLSENHLMSLNESNYATPSHMQPTMYTPMAQNIVMMNYSQPESSQPIYNNTLETNLVNQASSTEDILLRHKAYQAACRESQKSYRENLGKSKQCPGRFIRPMEFREKNVGGKVGKSNFNILSKEWNAKPKPIIESQNEKKVQSFLIPNMSKQSKSYQHKQHQHSEHSRFRIAKSIANKSNSNEIFSKKSDLIAESTNSKKNSKQISPKTAFSDSLGSRSYSEGVVSTAEEILQTASANEDHSSSSMSAPLTVHASTATSSSQGQRKTRHAEDSESSRTSVSTMATTSPQAMTSNKTSTFQDYKPLMKAQTCSSATSRFSTYRKQSKVKGLSMKADMIPTLKMKEVDLENKKAEPEIETPTGLGLNSQGSLGQFNEESRLYRNEPPSGQQQFGTTLPFLNKAATLDWSHYNVESPKANRSPDPSSCSYRSRFAGSPLPLRSVNGNTDNIASFTFNAVQSFKAHRASPRDSVSRREMLYRKTHHSGGHHTEDGMLTSYDTLSQQLTEFLEESFKPRVLEHILDNDDSLAQELLLLYNKQALGDPRLIQLQAFVIKHFFITKLLKPKISKEVSQQIDHLRNFCSLHVKTMLKYAEKLKSKESYTTSNFQN